MNRQDEHLKEDLSLRKPKAPQKQKVLLIAGAIALLVLLLLVGVYIPYLKKTHQSNELNRVSQSKDINDEELPKPKNTLSSVKERIKHYQAQEKENLDDEDIVSIVQKRQQVQETMESAHLLARIEAARIKAQEHEKMMRSSALSGMGAGSAHNQPSNNKQNAIAYENGNSAFLAHVGSEPMMEEEAGILGDLRFRITEGKLINGVIDGAIDSDLPGVIRAHVTEDVYGDQGNIILIPNGARLIGRYRSGKMKNGQTRIFIAWTRLIEPNGISVKLASIGSDSLGRAGMTGQVDKHQSERYGSAVLMSALSAGSSLYGANTQDQYNSVSQFRTGMSSSFSNMAAQEIEENVRIQNTIHIHQGTRLSILVSHDISFESVIRGMGVEA